MMHALSLCVQEGLEDRRAGDGLDDFVGDAAGGQGRVAEFQGEGGGGAVIGLVGGVERGAGVDAPGTDAEGGKGGEGPFVGAGYDTEFYWAAEEGRR